MKIQLTPEQRAQLEELRDRYRESAALFREVAETARAELKRRGMTDAQIDAELKKPRARRKRAAVEALAVELDRRRQKEPPFEWDDSVLASIATMPLPVFEPVDLSGLFEDVNLDSLLDDPPGTPGTPIFIPIDDD